MLLIISIIQIIQLISIPSYFICLRPRIIVIMITIPWAELFKRVRYGFKYSSQYGIIQHLIGPVVNFPNYSIRFELLENTSQCLRLHAQI